MNVSRRNFVTTVGAFLTHAMLGGGAARGEGQPALAESDAQRVTAKFAAAVGLSPKHSAAVRDFTQALEAAGLYDKLVAVYPCVGTTLAGVALNLLDPADEDGAFRLSFTGKAMADAKGIAWSASSKADTHVDHALITRAPSVGAAYYIHSAFDGAVMSNGEPGFTLVQRDAGTRKAYLQIAASADGIAYPADKEAGFWAMQRVKADADQLELYHAGERLGTETRAINSLVSRGTIVLNPQGVAHVMSYAAIGRALTRKEQADHHAAVKALLGGLGRLA
jgi:hypothetical protein